MTAETPPRGKHFLRSFARGMKRSWLMYTVFVVLVMATAAIFVGISGLARTNEQNLQLRRLVDCQNRYNEINNERTRSLAEANEKERATAAAADSALFAVVDAAVVPEKRSQVAARMAELKARLAEQTAARQEADQERKDHPVPPPPKALCGIDPKGP